MNKAIEDINQNQRKRIQYYDEVHGEGSYDAMFNKQIYDSNDDDTDNDSVDLESDDSDTNI
jgi:hypothetical protein